MTKRIDPSAVETAAAALEDFRRHGERLTLRETVERLRPTLDHLVRQGESWATITRILRANGIDAKPTSIRSYYHQKRSA